MAEFGVLSGVAVDVVDLMREAVLAVLLSEECVEALVGVVAYVELSPK